MPVITNTKADGDYPSFKKKVHTTRRRPLKFLHLPYLFWVGRLLSASIMKQPALDITGLYRQNQQPAHCLRLVQLLRLRF